MLKYALVSFTLRKEDYKEERWINFHSDSQGRFSIQNIPYGVYKIATTNDNAYLTVENNVLINHMETLVELRLEIKPID